MGLIKPIPIKSTIPTLEFRYNKVIGKYEPIRLLKKRKKAPVDEKGDLLEQILALNTEKDDDPVKRKQVYKRSKMSVPKPSQLVEDKILLDLKGIPHRHFGIASAPAKKTHFAIHHLETDETDETEDQDLRKESPFKNTIFEEDKEDYLKGFQSPFRKDLKDQGVQTTTGKPSPRKEAADEQQKSTPSLRPKKLLSIFTNTKNFEKQESDVASPAKIQSSPIKEVSFGDNCNNNNNDSFGNQKQESPDKIQDTSFTILSQDNGQASIIQEQVNEAKDIGVSREEPMKGNVELPTTPTFNLGQGKLFQFNNNNKIPTNATPIEKNEISFAGSEQTNQSSFEIKDTNNNKENSGNISFENVTEENKPENNTQQPIINIQPEEKPTPAQTTATFDFLKAYQTSIPSFDNNPFVAAASSKIDPSSFGDNPFLNPAKTDSALPSLFARKNSSSNSTNENSNQFKSAAPSTTGGSLFNNSQQNSNGLWGTNNETGTKLSSTTSSLFGGEKINNTPSGSSIFNNGMNMGNEMERESSMGMQNPLFNQQQATTNNNNFGLFQNNEQRGNLFGNMNNNNNNIAPQNNLFGGNGMSSMFSNTSNNNNNNMNISNSLFGNSNNNNNNTQSSNFGLFGNNFNQSGSGMNNGLFGNNLSNNNQQQNNLFSGMNQNSSNASNNNLFQGNPFLNPGASSNNNQGMSMGSQFQQNGSAQKDAANFLGLGSTNNQSTQQRVYRKIVSPFNNKNKERAF